MKNHENTAKNQEKQPTMKIISRSQNVHRSYPPASGLDSADPNGRLAQKAQLSIKLFILIAESENPPRLN